MKNQYFGDVNDYRKYGLIRALCGNDMRLGVCWMLTPDDGRNDGNFLGYLKRPEKWRDHDEDLFDALAQIVSAEGRRDVSRAKIFLGAATFWGRLLGDSKENRRTYIDDMLKHFADRDLIFFDPDNGLEVPSVPAGRKNSSKYLYWEELQRTWQSGHSLLIYQHFRRTKRDEFIRDLTAHLERALDARIISFRTAHVVFLLCAQHRHWVSLGEGAEKVRSRWAGQITTGIGTQAGRDDRRG
jgi:hypothetical protein